LNHPPKRLFGFMSWCCWYQLVLISITLKMITNKQNMLEFLTDNIIQSSLENSSGTLLDRRSIDIVISSIINSGNLNKTKIDELISDNESDSGYMVKSSDFVYVLKEYIIGQKEDFEPIEKSEKDLEIIELLYGEYKKR